jgi:hypothetical protein
VDTNFYPDGEDRTRHVDGPTCNCPNMAVSVDMRRGVTVVSHGSWAGIINQDESDEN